MGDLDGFFQRLKHAKNRVLLLDYDRTLAPFHEIPAQAYPYPGVSKALDRIMESNTRVVMVSGRPAKQLPPLMGLRKMPEIWGCHGWEHTLPDGTFVPPALKPSAKKALWNARAWIQEVERLGARCEHKSTGIAIHWRGLEDKDIVAIKAAVRERWMTLRLRRVLVWYDFDGGIEWRVSGKDKGYVVDVVLSGDPCVAAYLGDDVTDEDAFRAINGRGLSVLVHPEYRETAAKCWLRPPEELLEFFDRWSAACSCRRGPACMSVRKVSSSR